MTPACQWRWPPVTTCSLYYLQALTRVQSAHCPSLHINPLLWGKEPIYKCSHGGQLCRPRPTWIESMTASYLKGQQLLLFTCQHNAEQPFFMCLLKSSPCKGRLTGYAQLIHQCTQAFEAVSHSCIFSTENPAV